jgi:hypothetical protein
MSAATKRGLAPEPLFWQVWAASRVLLAIVLMVVVIRDRRRFSDALGNWDVQHYLTVAREGYANPQEMAFFPGLPAVLRLVAQVGVPMWLTGALFALVCSALAAWALHRIGGLVPAALWLVAPTAVFTVVGYTEAPFCAAAFWAWERARRGHWFAAALLATVACSFRVSGLFLVGALVVLALVGDGATGRRRRRDTGRPRQAWWMLVPTAALVAFSWYLHSLTGSWTAWFDAQKAGWGRGVHSPRESFDATWRAAQTVAWPDRPRVAWVFRAELVSMAVGIVTTLVCLAKKRWASAAYVGVMLVAFGTSVWWMSISRAVLLWFPLFLVVGELAGRADRKRDFWCGTVVKALVVCLFAACITADVVWAWLFFHGDWAS